MAVLGQGAAAGKPALLVKVVMAGESCVGKTSIVRRYTEPGAAATSSSYLATIGIDFKVKPITLNDTRVKLQIWDTAGQERFHTLSTSYFRGAQGFVLVYDITNMDSFQGITSWMKDIHEKAGDEVDVILLGNKCDKESERVVPKRKGEKEENTILRGENGLMQTLPRNNSYLHISYCPVSINCKYCSAQNLAKIKGFSRNLTMDFGISITSCHN